MKILCLDFDGVIHEYKSKWQAPDVISDGPVEGALEFIKDSVKHFDVAIFSSRSRTPEGIEAMKKWLKLNLAIAYGSSIAESISSKISFPTDKPPAHFTIDDRAMMFTGTFPAISEIKAFKPWNKKCL